MILSGKIVFRPCFLPKRALRAEPIFGSAVASTMVESKSLAFALVGILACASFSDAAAMEAEFWPRSPFQSARTWMVNPSRLSEEPQSGHELFAERF